MRLTTLRAHPASNEGEVQKRGHLYLCRFVTGTCACYPGIQVNAWSRYGRALCAAQGGRIRGRWTGNGRSPRYQQGTCALHVVGRWNGREGTCDYYVPASRSGYRGNSEKMFRLMRGVLWRVPARPGPCNGLHFHKDEDLAKVPPLIVIMA